MEICTVHIRFVRYTSVTRTLVGRSLPVTGSVRMRSLRLPRRYSPPLRRLPSPDKHFFAIFLSVRRPLPLSVFMWQHHLSTSILNVYMIRPVWAFAARSCIMNNSLVGIEATKHVFGVCHITRLKPVFSAAETS